MNFTRNAANFSPDPIYSPTECPARFFHLASSTCTRRLYHRLSHGLCILYINKTSLNTRTISRVRQQRHQSPGVGTFASHEILLGGRKGPMNKPANLDNRTIDFPVDHHFSAALHLAFRRMSARIRSRAP